MKNQLCKKSKIITKLMHNKYLRNKLNSIYYHKNNNNLIKYSN